jgi:hypothetical protein
MGIQIKNNASGTLATAINASDTGIVLTTGNGASFPVLGLGDYFYATLESTGGTFEVIRVTARSGDSMTVLRAQEGSIANSFAAGSRIELRVTAQSVADIAQLYATDADISLRNDLAAASGSSIVGFQQAGSGTALRTTQAKLRETVSVKDFGAVGDGVTDDTAAIQAAFDLAAQQQINAPYPGAGGFVHAGPEVYFPIGVYRVNSQIDVGITRSITMIGDGTVLILGDTGLSRGVSFFTGTGLRYLTVKNMWFQNFDSVFTISTSNLNTSKWSFENVRGVAVNLFVDSVSYDTSRSTIVSFKDCLWGSSCVQIARLFCDSVTFDNCWIASNDASTNSIYANSNLSFYACFFIPAGSGVAGRSAVMLTNDNGAGGTVNDPHRGVTFHGCRMSNEGGQGPIVVSDYPIPLDPPQISPTISFYGCVMTGNYPAPYQTGNSESGLVYLLQYPAAIKFDACSFFALGSNNSSLVAKSDSLTADAPDSFTISLDQATYYNAQRAVGAVESYTIAKSMAQFINNPAPYIFRNILENGNLDVGNSSTTGLKKSTFKITSGWQDTNYATPIIFFLFLGGQGTTGAADPNDVGYSGSSLYAVTVSFYFGSGAHRAKLAYTKIHGDTYGNNEAADCDIVSLHFGTGDTGSANTTRATSYDVTVTFGTNVLIGSARVLPGFEKISRFGNDPQ